MGLWLRFQCFTGIMMRFYFPLALSHQQVQGVHIQGFGALDLLLLHGSRGLEGIAKSTWGALIEKEHFISGALPGHLHFKTCLS